jgi:hypothetical protein
MRVVRICPFVSHRSRAVHCAVWTLLGCQSLSGYFGENSSHCTNTHQLHLKITGLSKIAFTKQLRAQWVNWMLGTTHFRIFRLPNVLCSTQVHVQIYIYIYIYIYIHTYIYTYIYTCSHTYKYTHEAFHVLREIKRSCSNVLCSKQVHGHTYNHTHTHTQRRFIMFSVRSNVHNVLMFCVVNKYMGIHTIIYTHTHTHTHTKAFHNVLREIKRSKCSNVLCSTQVHGHTHNHIHTHTHKGVS